VGNAITFDTTYKTNIYNMPLAMIISSPFDRAPLWLRLMLCLVRGSPTKRFSGRSHFSVEKRSRNYFGNAINYGFSETAPALSEKPLGRSPPKHTPSPPKWQSTNFWCCSSASRNYKSFEWLFSLFKWCMGGCRKLRCILFTHLFVRSNHFSYSPVLSIIVVY